MTIPTLAGASFKKCLLLFLLFVFGIMHAMAQHTYDFSTAPTIINPLPHPTWPWNTQANITIQGVEYVLTTGGNGSFEHISSEGNGGSACLRKASAGGDSFTLKRADNQPFRFYGLWLKAEVINSYKDLPGVTLPPLYTVTFNNVSGSAGTFEDNTPLSAGTYTTSEQTIVRDLEVNSVGIFFPANSKFWIDDIRIASDDEVPPLAIFGTSQTNVLCNGGSTGSASVIVTGGVTPYTYSWNPSGGSSPTASGLSAGTYSCLITDNAGTTLTRNFTITQPSALNATISKSDPTSYLGTNGTASVNVSGGIGAYSYSWAPSGGSSSTASGLSAGTYNCTITDANSCTVVRNITLVDPENVAPINSVPTVQSITFDHPLVFNDANTNRISVSDTDAGSNLIGITITATNGTLTLNGTTGLSFIVGSGSADATMTFEGTLTNINTVLNGLIYLPNTGYTGAASLQITSNDNGNSGTGGAKTDSDTIPINVTSTSPISTNVTSSSVDALYKIGDGLSFDVVFDQTVMVNTTGGSPTLLLETGAVDANATYVGGSGTNTLIFAYTVQEGDLNPDLDYQNSNALSLNGATIVNGANDNAVLTLAAPGSVNSISGQKDLNVDGVIASVTSVTVAADGTYTIGEVLYFTVNYDENVIVDTGIGVPDIGIALDQGGMVNAAYISGSGTSSLVFGTTVVADQQDHNGIVLNTSIVTNGGTILDMAGNAANNSLNAIGSTVNVRVDALVPELVTIKLSSNNGNPDYAIPGTTVSLEFTPSEAILPPTVSIGGNNVSAINTSGNTWNATYIFTNMDAEGDILFSIDYKDLANNDGVSMVVTTDGSSVVFDKTPPDIPLGFTVMAQDMNTVLNWSANKELDLLGYRIYQDVTNPPSSIKANLSASENTYTDTSLINGTTYYYRISALDLAGNESGLSNMIQSTPKADQTIDFKIIPPKTYGDSDVTLSATASSGLPINYTSSDPTIAEITGNIFTIKKAGTVTITAAQAGNMEYNAATPVTQTVSISKATLEVTANPDQTKVFGQADPELTYTANGFVNGENENLFTGSLTRMAGEEAGAYAIGTGSLNAGPNYIIDFSGASFIVSKAYLTVVAGSGQTKVYGQSDPKLIYTVSGFVNGDDQGILTGSLTRSLGEDVGVYPITLGVLSAGANYEISFGASDFEITKADQEIVWNQQLRFGCDSANSITLLAASSSGFPVDYSVSKTSIAGIQANVLTKKGSGTAEVTAFQEGDKNHNAAVSVTKTLQISQPGIIRQHWEEVLVFDNSSKDYVAWQWYKNGMPIQGATGQYYYENGALNGNYHVEATTKSAEIITSCPLELSGEGFTKKIKIIPNPIKAASQFVIECNYEESALNGATLSIFDLNGKMLDTVSLTGIRTQVIAPVQTGIYVISLNLSNGEKKTINLLVN